MYKGSNVSTIHSTNTQLKIRFFIVPPLLMFEIQDMSYHTENRKYNIFFLIIA